jgi:hypothetical protein
VVGIPFGDGRIVIAADPGRFTNETLRRGLRAVPVVRSIEWVAPDPDTPLIFDEYHHGYRETDDGLMSAALEMVARAPLGRSLLQLCAAALVLLAAVAQRPIRPTRRDRIERRSPLEHVTALSRAYEIAAARARATRLLVHGLQRRHARAVGTRDPESFLARVATRHPGVAQDIDIVTSAMAGNAAYSAADIAASINAIERTFHR